MSRDFTIATFNVNSINVRCDAVLAWLAKFKPATIGIQEIKATDEKFPFDAFEDYSCTIHGQPSYNGVALIGIEEPEEIKIGLDDDVEDPQARLIAGRFGDIWVINTYCPQGSQVGSAKFTYKLEWFRRFQAFLDRHFSPKDKLAWVGDYNIAPEDEDVYAPDFFDEDVGCNSEERALLESIRDWGFTDLFRHFHPDRRKAFTFFDYRTRDSVKYKKGWRIDHIWVTDSLLPMAKECDIDMEPRLAERASDHTPLWARFERP